MKPTLQLRTSQHLALTPQLQQSIRLLQLSTLELQQEVEHALTQNPMLEQADDWLSGSIRVNTDGSLRSERGTSAAEPPLGGSRDTAPPEGSGDQDGSDYGEPSRDAAGDWTLNDFSRNGNAQDDDDASQPQLHVDQTSLREHLLAQLNLTQASQRDRALVSFLIESLDEDGYLGITLDEIQHELLSELELETEELNAALALLQSFDPAGVGARNAAECLKLQLQRRPPNARRRVERL